jgi:hypothetical protein
VLQLLGEHLLVADRAFLQDRDRRHVGQRLADAGVGLDEGPDPNRFSVPITSSRRRIGSAWTER